MLNKKHRLAKTKDVELVFARGRSFFNPLVSVKFFRNDREKKRFTVVVSTKVSKKAVSRNRLKRILREFVRLRLDKFLPGDYAIVVRPAAAKTEEKVLLQELEKLFKKGGLLE